MSLIAMSEDIQLIIMNTYFIESLYITMYQAPF